VHSQDNTEKTEVDSPYMGDTFHVKIKLVSPQAYNLLINI